jgi:hypothetical protein
MENEFQVRGSLLPNPIHVPVSAMRFRGIARVRKDSFFCGHDWSMFCSCLLRRFKDWVGIGGWSLYEIDRTKRELGFPPSEITHESSD